MAPRRCSGYVEAGSVTVCRFNPWEAETKAQGKFDGKCVWCNPERMATVCATPRLRKLLAVNLRDLRRLQQDIYDQVVGKPKWTISRDCREPGSLQSLEIGRFGFPEAVARIPAQYVEEVVDACGPREAISWYDFVLL